MKLEYPGLVCWIRTAGRLSNTTIQGRAKKGFIQTRHVQLIYRFPEGATIFPRFSNPLERIYLAKLSDAFCDDSLLEFRIKFTHTKAMCAQCCFSDLIGTVHFSSSLYYLYFKEPVNICVIFFVKSDWCGYIKTNKVIVRKRTWLLVIKPSHSQTTMEETFAKPSS